jgi:hypothetical protein
MLGAAGFLAGPLYKFQAQLPTRMSSQELAQVSVYPAACHVEPTSRIALQLVGDTPRNTRRMSSSGVPQKSGRVGTPPNPRTPDPNGIATSIRLFQRAMTTGLGDGPDGGLNDSDRTLLAQLSANLPPESDLAKARALQFVVEKIGQPN